MINHGADINDLTDSDRVTYNNQIQMPSETSIISNHIQPHDRTNIIAHGIGMTESEEINRPTANIKPNFESIEQEIICPICNDIMYDPVIIESGISYCKVCIKKWLDNNNTCPSTKKIVSKNMLSNISLRNTIQSCTIYD